MKPSCVPVSLTLLLITIIGCRITQTGDAIREADALSDSWKALVEQSQLQCRDLPNELESYAEKTSRVRKIVNSLQIAQVRELVEQEVVTDLPDQMSFAVKTRGDYAVLCRFALICRLAAIGDEELLVAYLAKRWPDNSEVFIATNTPGSITTFLSVFDRTSSNAIRRRITSSLEEAGALRKDGDSDREMVVAYVTDWKNHKDIFAINKDYQRALGNGPLLLPFQTGESKEGGTKRGD
jgi:hypothetical protein